MELKFPRCVGEAMEEEQENFQVLMDCAAKKSCISGPPSMFAL